MIQPGTRGYHGEQPLDARQMAQLFLNSVVLIKVALLFISFQMSENPTQYNFGGFVLCILISMISLTCFCTKKEIMIATARSYASHETLRL